MRKIYSIIVLVLIVIFSVQSQENYSIIEKTYKIKKIDKQSLEMSVYQNGRLIEKGVVKNGKREGVWQFYDAKGKVITDATFVDGKKNGVWVVYTENNLSYVLHYKDNKKVNVNELIVHQ